MKYIIYYYFSYISSSHIIKSGRSGELNRKKKIYRKLFTNTFYLSAFVLGGGYVIVPLMKKKFADDLKIIDEDEILDLVAIAQSSPGAVAVNAAILLGYHVAGIPGALVTILGTVLPPFLTLTVISFLYTALRDHPAINAVLKGMQAGVAAVIADVVINLGGNVLKERDIVSVIIMAGAFIVTFFLEVNVVYTIIVCGCTGAVRVLIQNRKNRKGGDTR